VKVEELLDVKDIYWKPAGKDVLIHCLSPDHEDSTASTRVDRVSGVFNCLSCGNRGNIFDTFNELRDYKSEKIMNLRRKIQDIMAGAVDLPFPDGHVPYNQEFRGVKASVFRKLGAFTAPEFENRLVFPIRDINDRVVAFVARHMHSDQPPKYIVSPVYSKLPIYPAKAKPFMGSMLLVEGIFDYINLEDKGVSNVGCLFGTRTVSHKNIEERLMPMMLAGTKSVYILFDGDLAGRKAAEDLKKLINIKTRLVVTIVDLPDGVDPGSMDQEAVDKLMKQIYEKEA